MEFSESSVISRGRDSPDKLPSLFKYIASNEVAGFDSIRLQNDLNGQPPPAANGFTIPNRSPLVSHPEFSDNHPFTVCSYFFGNRSFQEILPMHIYIFFFFALISSFLWFNWVILGNY